MRFLSVLTFLLMPVFATASPPQVVTDIRPVQALVARVMDGIAEPAVIFGAGVSAHHHALRPSDAAALENADLVIWIGPELAPQVERARRNLAADTPALTLMDAPGTLRLAARASSLFEAAHDHGHGHGHSHGHDHGPIDPHGWLAPANARVWIDVIATTLADFDPDNAARYAANAEAGRAEIDAAVAEARQMLESVETTVFLAGHDSLQYFEESFGLNAIGALSLSDDAPPGARHIAALRDVLAERDVSCVLVDPGVNTNLVGSVFDDRPHTVRTADPLGAEIDSGRMFYPALIVSIAAAARECLS